MNIIHVEVIDADQLYTVQIDLIVKSSKSTSVSFQTKSISTETLIFVEATSSTATGASFTALTVIKTLQVSDNSQSLTI